LHDLVVSRRFTHRPFLTEAADGTVDQPRVDACERVVAQAKSIHHAGPKILDQHVGALHQAAEYFFAALQLEIQRDRFLATVLRHERCAHQLLAEFTIRPQLPREVADSGHFHLDHLGAR
jgi:hypothetical protein